MIPEFLRKHLPSRKSAEEKEAADFVPRLTKIYKKIEDAGATNISTQATNLNDQNTIHQRLILNDFVRKPNDPKVYPEFYILKLLKRNGLRTLHIYESVDEEIKGIDKKPERSMKFTEMTLKEAKKIITSDANKNVEIPMEFSHKEQLEFLDKVIKAPPNQKLTHKMPKTGTIPPKYETDINLREN
jgi:hypothetical protein